MKVARMNFKFAVQIYCRMTTTDKGWRLPVGLAQWSRALAAHARGPRVRVRVTPHFSHFHFVPFNRHRQSMKSRGCVLLLTELCTVKVNCLP